MSKVHNIKTWYDTSFSSVVTYCGLQSLKASRKVVMSWRGIPKKDRCLRYIAAMGKKK